MIRAPQKQAQIDGEARALATHYLVFFCQTGPDALTKKPDSCREQAILNLLLSWQDSTIYATISGDGT